MKKLITMCAAVAMLFGAQAFAQVAPAPTTTTTKKIEPVKTDNGKYSKKNEAVKSKKGSKMTRSEKKQAAIEKYGSEDAAKDAYQTRQAEKASKTSTRDEKKDAAIEKAGSKDAAKAKAEKKKDKKNN